MFYVENEPAHNDLNFAPRRRDDALNLLERLPTQSDAVPFENLVSYLIDTALGISYRE